VGTSDTALLIVDARYTAASCLSTAFYAPLQGLRTTKRSAAPSEETGNRLSDEIYRVIQSYA
jgi:hypothetical protein